jgi:carbon storage regulator
MLVLQRKVGEKIRIMEEILVTVTEITPFTIKLGFNAPPDCAIYREEIYQAKKRELQKTVDVRPKDDIRIHGDNGEELTVSVSDVIESIRNGTKGN